ncbi:MAG TPA: TrbG/VirB9 family P-type conjugative transfer protein [Sphingomonas sp.]|nr:TrbG/VirB9 family P-type conjugative transfer protein [Sphingomonas sp.]
MKLAAALIAFAMAACGGPAAGQVLPQPGNGDPHIQTVQYSANQVVQLQTAPGYELTVGLAADDAIESVAVGDSADWQVSASHSGDHLFIKALQGGVGTNMTVVTANRVYVFDLVSLASPSPTMAYTVQFDYPTPAPNPALGSPGVPKKVVGEYVVHGDRSLRPDAISDDGEHTYIVWPANAALPATYFRNDNGVETLANGHMRDGSYVIDSVHPELVFRIDKHHARADRVEPRQADHGG